MRPVFRIITITVDVTRTLTPYIGFGASHDTTLSDRGSTIIGGGVVR